MRVQISSVLSSSISRNMCITSISEGTVFSILLLRRVTANVSTEKVVLPCYLLSRVKGYDKNHT